MRGIPYSAEENSRLLAMVAAGARFSAIGLELKRGAASVSNHYYYLVGRDGKLRDRRPIKSIAEIARERAQRHATEQRALEARDRRELARIERDEKSLRHGVVTPVYFGDPPPGYSALDRRRA